LGGLLIYGSPAVPCSAFGLLAELLSVASLMTFRLPWAVFFICGRQRKESSEEWSDMWVYGQRKESSEELE